MRPTTRTCRRPSPRAGPTRIAAPMRGPRRRCCRGRRLWTGGWGAGGNWGTWGAGGNRGGGKSIEGRGTGGRGTGGKSRIGGLKIGAIKAGIRIRRNIRIGANLKGTIRLIGLSIRASTGKVAGDTPPEKNSVRIKKTIEANSEQSTSRSRESVRTADSTTGSRRTGPGRRTPRARNSSSTYKDDPAYLI
jgi:hypothetical protein